MKKGVIICSGGLDSTVLYHYLKQDNELIPINFYYGSKHNKSERARAEILIPEIRKVDIDLSFLNSALLSSNKENIPHGHYQEENMKSTVVPFRNGIMLAYAIAIAESEGAQFVALGSHAGDHAIYPDCRPDFTKAISEAASFGTYGKIEVVSPFNALTKSDIAAIGKSLGIASVMNKTWSCYEGGEIHCGKCGACTERKEAFAFAQIEDVTIYKE